MFEADISGIACLETTVGACDIADRRQTVWKTTEARWRGAALRCHGYAVQRLVIEIDRGLKRAIAVDMPSAMFTVCMQAG